MIFNLETVIYLDVLDTLAQVVSYVVRRKYTPKKALHVEVSAFVNFSCYKNYTMSVVR